MLVQLKKPYRRPPHLKLLPELIIEALVSAMPVDMTKVAAAAGTKKTPKVSVGFIAKIMNDVTFEDQWAQLSMLGYEH